MRPPCYRYIAAAMLLQPCQPRRIADSDILAHAPIAVKETHPFLILLLFAFQMSYPCHYLHSFPVMISLLVSTHSYAYHPPRFPPLPLPLGWP